MTDNTFKQNTFVLKEDGKIYFVAVPDFPAALDQFDPHDVRYYETQILQKAIDDAVEVSNQNEIDFFLVSKYNELEKNKAYTLNCRVEIINRHYFEKNLIRHVAHVTFPEDKPEQRFTCYNCGELVEGANVSMCDDCKSLVYSEPIEEPEQKEEPEAAGPASLQKQVESLEKENAAANKRIEELTAKNLKLLNENNDLWDKVNNPKMKV